MEGKFEVILIISCLIAAGIGLVLGHNRDVEEYQKKQKNPVVTLVSRVDGCEVSYVDRGLKNENFYITKCPEKTNTTTKHINEKEGRQTKESVEVTVNKGAK